VKEIVANPVAYHTAELISVVKNFRNDKKLSYVSSGNVFVAKTFMVADCNCGTHRHKRIVVRLLIGTDRQPFLVE
jgi:hypothetical protein